MGEGEPVQKLADNYRRVTGVGKSDGAGGPRRQQDSTAAILKQSHA